MDNNIEIFKNYDIKTIKTKNGMAMLGKPAEVVDEGWLLRIADMYVVEKSDIVNVSLNGDILRIDCKNDNWFEFGICEKNTK